MGIEEHTTSSINFVRFLVAQGGRDVVGGGWYACFISINIFCPIEMLHFFWLDFLNCHLKVDGFIGGGVRCIVNAIYIIHKILHEVG
jgi:hypothetical protein